MDFRFIMKIRKRIIILKMNILESNNLFGKWDDLMCEVRRCALGKYKNNDNGFSLEEYFPTYKGEAKCHHKFNFLEEGNRCPYCNSISLLSSDGDIKNKAIQVGSVNLYVKSIDSRNLNFSYHRKNIDFDYLERMLPPIDQLKLELSKYRDIKFLVSNQSNGWINRILISSLNMVSSNSPSNIRFAYLCDSLKIVYENNATPILNIDNFTSEMIYSIFVQIFLLVNSSYNPGKFNFNDITITNVAKKATIGKKTISLDSTLYVQPNQNSNIIFDGYHKDRLCFLGTEFTELEPFRANIKLSIGKDLTDLNPARLDSSKIGKIPMLNSLNAIIVIQPTVELFDFTEKTGIKVFRPLDLYVWILGLLSIPSFYRVFMDKYTKFFNALFFTDERELIKVELQQNHNMNYEQVRNFMIRLNFSMRFDAIERIAKII